MEVNLIYDMMSGGHGAKNLAAMITAPAFSSLRLDKTVLSIPDVQLERLREIVGTLDDSITVHEQVLEGAGFGIRRQWQAVRQLLAEVRREKYTSILFMSGDWRLLAVPLVKLFSRKSALVLLIYRPVIHYKEMGYKRGERVGRERIPCGSVLKNWLLFLFLKTGIVSRVAFQDEGAVEWYAKRGCDARWFPTPPAIPEFGVLDKREGKVVFTLFGALSARKGVFSALTAFQSLSLDVLSKVRLQLIGAAREQEAEIEAAVQCARQAGVDVVLDARFIDHEEIKGVYEGSDVMLMLYEGALVAGSGVLIQSLAFGLPVLSTDVGWVGKTVSENPFGLAVSPSDRKAICDAVVSFCNKSVVYDSGKMIEFARQHTPEKYGEVMVGLLSNRG